MSYTMYLVIYVSLTWILYLILKHVVRKVVVILYTGSNSTHVVMHLQKLCKLQPVNVWFLNIFYDWDLRFFYTCTQSLFLGKAPSL